MKNTLLGTLTLALAIPLALHAADLPAAPADLNIQNLRCEYLTNPIGIDTNPPRLSWTLSSTLFAVFLCVFLKATSALWYTGKGYIEPS